LYRPTLKSESGDSCIIDRMTTNVTTIVMAMIHARRLFMSRKKMKALDSFLHPANILAGAKFLAGWRLETEVRRPHDP